MLYEVITLPPLLPQSGPPLSLLLLTNDVDPAQLDAWQSFCEAHPVGLLVITSYSIHYTKLYEERFLVGLSIDGPRELHDHYRVTRSGKPTFDRVMAAADFV